MSETLKSLAFMAAGFAIMIFAHFHFGDTAPGFAMVFVGLGVYYYGWRGICPACRAGRCAISPPKDADRLNQG